MIARRISGPRDAPVDWAGRMRIAALFFFGLMLAAGSLPGKAHALASIAGDKPLHACAYAMLTVLLYFGLPAGVRRRPAGALLVLGFLGLLGAADESLQAMFPYRHSDAADWAVNMIAGVLSLAALFLVNAARRRGTNAGDAGRIE